MGTILDKIVATKWREIEASRNECSELELRKLADTTPPPKDFFGALAQPGPIRLIAEVKKASPSAGIIRTDFDPEEIARTYQAHSASCISVLTDEPHFQGKLEDLRRIRAVVDLPLLRKDFILDPYQIFQARAAGADAVLLIAECLDDRNLRLLFRQTVDLGMTPLVEFYEPHHLPRVLDAGATLIGINNRNLRTFQVDLHHTLRMREQIPKDHLVVGESGIRDFSDAQRLEAAGVDAMLVGEHLMRQPDIGAAIDKLLGSLPRGNNGSEGEDPHA